MTFKYFVPIWVWIESDRELKNSEVVFHEPIPDSDAFKVVSYATKNIERDEDG